MILLIYKLNSCDSHYFMSFTYASSSASNSSAVFFCTGPPPDFLLLLRPPPLSLFPPRPPRLPPRPPPKLLFPPCPNKENVKKRVFRDLEFKNENQIYSQLKIRLSLNFFH